MVRGLHRTATATHILGNYIIQNAKAVTSNTPLYSLKKSSSLNSGIAVRIISTTNGQHLNHKFIVQAKNCSETVNNRKHKALKFL